MVSTCFSIRLMLRCFILFFIFYSCQCNPKVVQKSRTFEVDYENNQFLMDGEPFKYASGEMHYFRIPRAYWKDRLHKVRAAGFNAIQTYIEWSQHEPSPGQYNFSGELDFEHYVQLAQEEGLYVILRPGPYICAERDFGGYPAWLLTMNPNMKLRTSDATHTFFVERWFNQLLPRVQPLLYGNGGPVIMVQVENEYGSYPINDQKYLAWLRDLYRSYVDNAAVLFTTDGPSLSYVSRGNIPGVFATIDFGSSDDLNSTYANLRKIQPNGPLVNSEYYSGWLLYWGEKFPRVASGPYAALLRTMLQNNISVSAYMVHGGTNFGFTAGSGSSDYYQPDLTTYDYDAPISEAGDLTEKYFAIRDVLSEFFPVLNISTTPAPKGDYGSVTLKPIISLFDSPVSTESVITEYPTSFEKIGQSHGFVAYHTTVSNTTVKDPSVLQVNVRDRAIVYLNNEEVGVLQYTVINETPLPTTFSKGQQLTLLIENLGRRNFQMLSDCTKGLISNATINGDIVKNWRAVGYPLSSKDIANVEGLANNDTTNVILPAFYTAQFQFPEGQEPLDTFLDMSNWGKGVVFINQFNLGRYWHIGPQVTLYTPGCYLRPYPEYNTITLLELHYTAPDLSVKFTSQPILDKPIGVKGLTQKKP